MRALLMYLFFILSTIVLLPSWILASAGWLLQHGSWSQVGLGEFAQYACSAKDRTLFVANLTLWGGIIAVYLIVKYF